MWQIAGKELGSRMFLGSAQYPSPDSLRESIRRSGTEVVTFSVRRQAAGDVTAAAAFWDLIRSSGVRILPNTAGCRSSREAITTAQLARDLFDTPWIKLEVIGNERTLQPDPFGLVEAARELCAQGFTVFPYTTDDLVLAERLLHAGCRVLMPWGSPIGTGRGIQNAWALRTLRAEFPTTSLIVDAGLGAPSHAAQAMELGMDGVLLNTAVARSQDPPAMAEAFAAAVSAGHAAYRAGLIPARDVSVPSTPTLGTPFWHSEAQS